MALLSKWRNLRHAAYVLLVALLVSCAGGGGHPPPPEGNLRVFNDGNLTLRHLYVTPSTSSTWGVDQLTPSFLLPTESITLTRLYPGSYDVQARFSDASWDQVYDVRIQDGVTTVLGMMNTGNGSVEVFNNSGFPINGIYLTPHSATTWGPNQADQPLISGDKLTLTGVAPGAYDLRVVFSSGPPVDFLNFGVASGAVTPITVI
jgi:hypothetical protein